jgi:transcriptional regulator with XRE-family HTH domain
MGAEQKSQRKIAAEIGVPQPAVSRWLRGVVIPTDRHLEALAASLGMAPDALLLELRRRRRERNAPKKNLPVMQK